MLSTEVCDQVVGELRIKVEGVLAIYLFGSAANTNFRDESDVDIAYLTMGQGPQGLQKWNVIADLSALLNRDVDLIDFNDADTTLQMQIVSTGKLIFKDPSFDQDEFENRIFQLYLTLNEDRKEVLRGISEDLTIYG